MKRKISILSLYLLMIFATISLGGFVVGLEQYDKKKSEEIKVYVKTTNNSFQVMKKGNWENIFIKGINIGAALPGKWFTEFPEDDKVYLDWFEKIGQMNANCIRIYTLLPPQFYSALHTYNSQHPKATLWLLQEIWPEENPEGHDYLKKAYVDEYFTEIERVVDAIHGKANILERKGRAYGVYTKDVSKYVLGYLVGRELEPDEIIETNAKNKGYSFSGEYLSSGSKASPSEAWLAMNCNYVLKYEENKYRSQHPVAIVSWPTLDVKEHDSEWNSSNQKSFEYNDKVSIDINNINTEVKMKAGFFGAYHIYPNYPDFMNNETKYNDYYDETGRLRYGGYLQEFISGHTRYPALVAEFGLPTGMGNAHTSPDGLNHGGLTEEQQGIGTVRMMKAIKKEGYAGGVIFEWMDEWAKKTWITEPYMIPYDRHAYWRNALDPEQNYGLLAMESEGIKGDGYTKLGNGAISSITVNHNETFLYLNVKLNRAFELNKEKLLIGLDTYDRSKGEVKFTKESDITAPTGLEFMLDINDEENSKIMVHPGYNISNKRYSSYASSKGIFEEIRFTINSERVTKDGQKIEASYQESSKLNFGTFDENSYNHWYIEGNVIHIRIPWGRINFTDPSNLMVLNDDESNGELSRDKLKIVKTDGILVSALLLDVEKNEGIDIVNTEEPYIWESWDEPMYKERLKKSYYIIKEYFGKL